jgi:hypothetical protein
MYQSVTRQAAKPDFQACLFSPTSPLLILDLGSCAIKTNSLEIERRGKRTVRHLENNFC